MNITDLHTHTCLSDGSLTPEALLAEAQKRGCGLGISDHAFCCNMYTLEDIRNYLQRISQLPVLRGLECNIGEDYSLPGELDAQVDYVIASVHAMAGPRGEKYPLGDFFCYESHLTQEESVSYCDRMFDEYAEATLKMAEQTFRTQRADIYGHALVVPFYARRRGTPEALDFENAVISLCRRYHLALEISGLWESVNEGMLRRAKAAGVRFTFGSDCHLAKDACDLTRAVALAELCGLVQEDFFLPVRI